MYVVTVREFPGNIDMYVVTVREFSGNIDVYVVTVMGVKESSLGTLMCM